jgi:hypothetical protein
MEKNFENKYIIDLKENLNKFSLKNLEEIVISLSFNNEKERLENIKKELKEIFFTKENFEINCFFGTNFTKKWKSINNVDEFYNYFKNNSIFNNVMLNEKVKKELLKKYELTFNQYIKDTKENYFEFSEKEIERTFIYRAIYFSSFYKERETFFKNFSIFENINFYIV